MTSDSTTPFHTKGHHDNLLIFVAGFDETVTGIHMLTDIPEARTY